MENLLIFERPKLKKPYLVAGFSGWPNAGEVSTGVLTYLRNKLRAKRFAEIIPNDFYDFSSHRPVARIEEGALRELKFPSNDFFYWQNEKARHDLVLLLGVEPHLRWTQFIETVLRFARELETEMFCAVGGVFDQVPHTQEPRVAAAANDPRLQRKIASYGLEFASYQGPSSLHTAFLAASKAHNIKCLTIWGRAPHYVSIPNPQVCYGVLKRLVNILELDISLDEIRRAGEYLVEQVNKVVAQNARLQEYVRRLEEGYVLPRERTEEVVEDGRIIREIEDFLKKSGEEKENP